MARKKELRSPEELREEIAELKQQIREQAPVVRKTYDEYYTLATKLQRVCEQFKELDNQLAEAEKRVVYLKPGQSGKKKGGDEQPKDPKEQLNRLLKGMSREEKEKFIRNLLT